MKYGVIRLHTIPFSYIFLEYFSRFYILRETYKSGSLSKNYSQYFFFP